MARFYDMAGWLLSSLGLALLVCGLVLVPQNRLLGDEPVEEIGYGCAFDECDLTCTVQAPPCTGTQAPCSNDGGGARNCDTCKCRVKPFDGNCHCLLTP
jgi:hypothetical protein